MVTEDIIVKCLAGEAEQHELTMVDQWRKTSPENEKQYNQLKKLWESSANISERPVLDVEKAWNKVNSKIEAPKGKIISFKNYWMAAASVVVVIGLSLLFFRNSDSGAAQMLTATATTQPSTLNLKDGSRVVLKSGQFKYPDDFKNSRKVILEKGTAFFDIARDTSHPFTIECGASEVTVLGTEFEIRTDDNQTSVKVREGKVKFKTPKGVLLLTAGMGATFDQTNSTLSPIQGMNNNQFQYATGELEFNESTLSSVVVDVEEAFKGKELIFMDVQNDCKITAKFSSKDGFQNVAAVIAATIGGQLILSEDGRIATIKGGQCR